MKVLIAEDNLISQKILIRNLKNLQMKPIILTNGIKVYKKYKEDKEINFLILNWYIPFLEGPLLCEKIRKLKTKNRLRPYIILLTCCNSKKEIIYGLKSGADDFISKPFDKELFLVRVNAGKKIIEAENDNKTAMNKLQKQCQKQVEDLKYAQMLQKNLNTIKLPLLKAIGIQSLFMLSDKLSGDFFVIQVSPKGLIIFIADYSGHGIKVAMSATICKSTADRHMHLLHQGNTASFFYAFNNDLVKYIRDQGEFCTVFTCFIDLQADLMHYCNANHPLPLFLRKEKLLEYESTQNFFLGYEENTKFTIKTIKLTQNDKILFYSDAACEIIKDNTIIFDKKKLEKTFLSLKNQNLSETLKGLVKKFKKINQSLPLADDCTLILIQKMNPYKAKKKYNKSQQLDQAIEELKLELTSRNYLEDEIGKIIISYNELFLNAIQHGNKCDPNKKITIQYDIDFKQCLIIIANEGGGFDPNRLKDPTDPKIIKKLIQLKDFKALSHGRGIWMVKRYATCFSVNEKGNKATFLFKRKEDQTSFLY